MLWPKTHQQTQKPCLGYLTELHSEPENRSICVIYWERNCGKSYATKLHECGLLKQDYKECRLRSRLAGGRLYGESWSAYDFFLRLVIRPNTSVDFTTRSCIFRLHDLFHYPTFFCKSVFSIDQLLLVAVCVIHLLFIMKFVHEEHTNNEIKIKYKNVSKKEKKKLYTNCHHNPEPTRTLTHTYHFKYFFSTALSKVTILKINAGAFEMKCWGKICCIIKDDICYSSV